MCLGQEDAADLKIPLRNSEGDEALTGSYSGSYFEETQGS
jgi:hypothetical protein